MDKKRVYKCPDCGLVAVRTAKEMEGNRITKGQLPAFLVCGKCYSGKPSKSVRMWGDDIPEEDRNEKEYNVLSPHSYTNYGLEPERVLKKFEKVHDISFAGCKRYLVRVIAHGPLCDRELRDKAIGEVWLITATKKVSAIAVGFWRTRGEAMKCPAVAMVNWAPGGVWGDANTVKMGDYSKHKYDLEFNHY